MNKKRFTRKLKKGTSAKFTRSKKTRSSSKKKTKTNSDIKDNDVSKSSIILSNLEKKKKGTLSNINYRSFGMAARMSRL
jgi:hypothetical protein